VSVYSDIMNSISDAVFSADGRFIVSRDYLSVNVWDIRVESRPAETIQVHEHLRGHLPEVYDNDCIFDKFECAVSSDTSCIVTGSYNDLFHVYNRRDKTDTCVEAATDGAQSLLSLSPSEGRHAMEVGRAIDFEKKALHVAMCPAKGTLAVAAGSKLGLYEPLPSHSET
jgi:serine/threonine-protein phosphatase 2A regulatory subunit B